MKKDWGNGIPEYKQEDIMTKEEIHNFAMETVYKHEIESKKYKVLMAKDIADYFPNFVVEKDNVKLFILVMADVAPNIPQVPQEKKDLFIKYAEKYGGKAMFAPVSFGACDRERFNLSLMLRGDAFYTRYCGLEEIYIKEDL